TRATRPSPRGWSRRSPVSAAISTPSSRPRSPPARGPSSGADAMRWTAAACALAPASTPSLAAPARHHPAAAHATTSAAAASDWRTLDPENALVIDTSKGRIIVEMVPEAAPKHVAQIRKLARAGTYDGLVFFRVIDWFMDQT